MNPYTNRTVPVQDLAGNMTTLPQPANLGSGYTAKYDAWNRLVELKDGATTVATYAYDGGNRRVTKTTSSTRHYYYSDQWQVLGGTDGHQYECGAAICVGTAIH